jgi:hypothetical protein
MHFPRDVGRRAEDPDESRRIEHHAAAVCFNARRTGARDRVELDG